MRYRIALLILLLGLAGLLRPAPSNAVGATIYTRYFESIDTFLADIYQVYSVTALAGEKITIVVYGLDEDVAPAITLLNPTGITIATDMNLENTDTAVVQAVADVNGIYPFVVSRNTEDFGMLRLMVFEGDPLDYTTTILDTIDPFQPSRAYLVAAEKTDPGQEPQALEFAIQSRPFDLPETDEIEDEDDLPLPQYFASRGENDAPPALDTRLIAAERFDWQNEAGVGFYTVNIRPVPEALTIGMEVEAEQLGLAIPTLEQPLLPYDILFTVKPGIDPPVRLERPICETTYTLTSRTLVVRNVPDEDARPIGQISGGTTVQIIGTDDTGAWIQIAWEDALNGTGWVQNQDFYDADAPDCQRVLPGETDMVRLDAAIQAVIDALLSRNEVADIPTPAPTLRPTPEGTPFLQSDLLLTATVDNGFPNEGSTLVFTMAVGNFTNGLLESPIITFTLPPGLTYVWTSEQCVSATPTTCTLPDIPAGEVRGYTITATVDQGTLGQTLISTATAVLGELSYRVPVPVTVVASPGAEPPPPGDILAITKTVDNPTPVEAGAVTFTLTALNQSGQTMTDVTASDLLPAGLTFTSFIASQGSYNPASGVWTLGNFNAGASATLNIAALVNGGTYPSTITNTATIASASLADGNMANNTASAAITVSCVAGGIGVPAADTTALINAITTANLFPDVTTLCLQNSTYAVAGANNNTNGDNGLPSVTSPIIVLGNGATVTRSGAAPYRLFHVGGGDLTLQNLFVTNGDSGFDSGGAVAVFTGSLTLDAATLTANRAAAAVTGGGILNAGGTVTIQNGTLLNANAAGAGSAVRNLAGSTLIVDNSIITANNSSLLVSGGAIYNSGTLIIRNSAQVNGNGSAGTGGGIYSDAGTVTISTGSLIINNYSGFGGGIYNSGTSALTLSDPGTTVSGNTCGSSGGGINNNGTATIVINAGVTIGASGAPNVCSTGGGIVNSSTSLTAVTINGGTIRFNEATSTVGGGIYTTGGNVNINSGAIISDNQAATQGGGIYSGSLVTIDNSIIDNNDATQGGGIANIGTLVLQNNSGVTNNSATGVGARGGGIFSSTGTVNITGGYIDNNSSNSGGGIANEGTSALTLNGVVMRSNNCANNGGAILNSNTATTTITGGSIIGGGAIPNACNFGGGIYNNSTSATAVTISGSTITGNRAFGGQGGGLFTNNGTVTITGSFFTANEAAWGGGGIENEGGTVNISGTNLTGNIVLNPGNGGGINNILGSTLTATSNNFLNNVATAGGGIFNSATATLNTNTFTTNTPDDCAGVFGGTGNTSDGTCPP